MKMIYKNFTFFIFLIDISIEISKESSVYWIGMLKLQYVIAFA